MDRCPRANQPRRWQYLEAGISRIMNDLEQGIDMQMYMGVYTCVLVLSSLQPRYFAPTIDPSSLARVGEALFLFHIVC